MARFAFSTPDLADGASRCGLPPLGVARMLEAGDQRSAPVAVDVDDTAHAGSAGPGWFDSSWDLRYGLEVREGLPADASLDEWLAAWGGASPSAATRRATASPSSITAIA